MAAAAELQFDMSHWGGAEDIAQVYSERLQSDVDSANILEARMRYLREGEWSQVPYAVDPLTTAAMAVEARELYGAGSAEYGQKRSGIVLDCERLLAEAQRKLTWEYFPGLVQRYDMEQDSYAVNGRSLIDIVTDGVTPIAETEEVGRRVAERREEVTYRSIGRLMMRGVLPDQPAAAPVSIFTISECPDWAHEDLARNPHGAHGGYVPEINKFVIRSVAIDQVTGVRYEEQLAVPGTVIGHDDIVTGLRMLGAVGRDEAMGKTDVLSRQVVSRKAEGALTMLKLFDSVASERTGRPVFIGGVVDEDHPRDYDAIPSEAVARQARLKADAEELADYTMLLAEKKADSMAAEPLVAAFVKSQIFNTVKNSPEDARAAFDDVTADKLVIAAMEREMGNYDEADRLEVAAELEAPPIVFCGAGVCGLEGVMMGTALWLTARSIGLTPVANGEFLSFAGASCLDCGNKSVLFGANGKACGDCGYSEIDGVTSGGKTKRTKSLGLFALAV